jgi:WD40 repeat protein
LKGHKKTVTSADFSPDGKTVVSSSYDATLIIWDVEKGKQLKILKGHPKNIGTVKFSPNGKKLFSGGIGNKIFVWNSRTGKLLEQIPGHSTAITTILFSPNQKYLMTKDYKGKGIIWDVTTTSTKIKKKTEFSISRSCAAWSPDSKIIAFGTKQMIKIFHVIDQEFIEEIPVSSNVLNSIVFSPNSKWLILGTADKKISIWDVSKLS